jgi:hypothetical protein
LVAKRSARKAELHVAVKLGSLLLNFVVLDVECWEVETTEWKESDFHVKLN